MIVFPFRLCLIESVKQNKTAVQMSIRTAARFLQTGKTQLSRRGVGLLHLLALAVKSKPLLIHGASLSFKQKTCLRAGRRSRGAGVCESEITRKFRLGSASSPSSTRS
jgi:hypothetical protein